jgi:hypothetical protein
MILPHFVHSRVFPFTTALAPALAASALLALPAGGHQAATPAQQLTGQSSRAVLQAESPRLHWDAPGGALWARGEASLGEAPPTPAAEAGFERGAIALGARRELTLLPHLSWAIAPQLRVEAAADSHGLPTAPAIDASMQQDLALTLPGNARLAATIGLGDRIGVSALTAPGGAQAAPTLRAKAALALQGQFAGAPLRTEFQLITVRTVAAGHGPDRALSCELGLAVSWAGGAPLRLASSCPGEAARRLTLGISAAF